MPAFTHENSDVGAEADTFRDAITDASVTSKITSDTHDLNNNRTSIEYVAAEGDPPFIKYRLTLEPIAALTPEQYEAEKAVK